MLDIKLLRKDSSYYEKKLKTKDPEVSLAPVLALDEKIREIKASVEEMKAKRNHLSQEIGEKKRKKEDASTLMKEVSGMGEKIAELDRQLACVEAEFTEQLASLPNLPLDEIKVSSDPKDNVCIKTRGEKPDFSFPFKNHVELNERLDIFDFPARCKNIGKRLACL